MENSPEFALGSSSAPHDQSALKTESSVKRVQKLIDMLQYSESREQALHLLSKDKGIWDDLALYLWNSFGAMFTLLQEVVATYRILSSPHLIERASTRVCNALALLQTVASHPQTKKHFIKANIPFYLYPLLGSTSNEKSIEFLRLTSLGVIGALVKVDDDEVIHFLLQSEIFRHCLHCMDVGGELSKTVATFIVHRILMHDEGLKYCCSTAERFFAVSKALGSMVEKLTEEPSPRLLKQILRCYIRLSDRQRACDGLRGCLPKQFRDNKFVILNGGDSTTLDLLRELFCNVFKSDPAAKVCWGMMRS